MRKNKSPAQKHLEKVLASKLELRRQRAGLSYVEKIRLVIEMQKMSKKFKRDPSRPVYVWTL